MAGPEHSVVRLSEAEQRLWHDVLRAETREDGRRMIELWAESADGGNPRLLDDVFRLMWAPTEESE